MPKNIQEKYHKALDTDKGKQIVDLKNKMIGKIGGMMKSNKPMNDEGNPNEEKKEEDHVEFQ